MYHEYARATFPAAEAIAANVAVTLCANGVKVCTASDIPVGFSDIPAFEAGSPISVRLINLAGTVEVKISGTVAKGDTLSPAAAGALKKAAAFPYCGIAMEAGSDGDIITVRPFLQLAAAAAATA